MTSSPTVNSALVFISLAFGALVSAAEYDLYLLAGQSNMDGRGKIAKLTKAQKQPSKNTIIFYRNPPHASDGWQPLAPGFSIPPKHKTGLPSPTFGPEIGFASTLQKNQPNRKLALIKGSKGGTSLRKDWHPGTKDDPASQGQTYRHFIQTFRLATADLTKQGHTFKLRGLLWHQGESDSKASTEKHHLRLVSFAQRIREDLNSPNLPIIVGEVFDNGKRDTVRAALQKFSKEKFCALVSSKETTTWDPGTHFDAKSQLLLGQRYAQAILKLKN